MKEVQPGIFTESENLYSLNADRGSKVYGEELKQVDGKEFRRWDPNRSKAAAAVKKGLNLEISRSDTVLYLGAASGTTVSHFSDILTEGFIVAVEYSDTVIRDLLDLAESRDNIAPVLADARKPEEYQEYLDEADIVFQDISQRDQAQIFSKNCEKFLKADGVGLLSVKARSVSSSKNKDEIFSEVKEELSEKLEILEEVELRPYEKEHLFLKVKRK
ncbi:MAG: fibrillarin-like rRNA/tRNA 2'-O-methyltransferase [Candidatus Nanohalobium sp.]